MSALAEALTLMREAFPRQPFGDRAVRVYAEQLADLDGALVLAAVTLLVRTSPYMPTIADVRNAVAESSLALPTPEEAWERVLEGDLSVPEIKSAVKAVGGMWEIQHGDRPHSTADRFRKHYEAKRKAALQAAAAGRPILPEQLKRNALPPAGVESLPARRLREIPETTRIRPRPVMWRLGRRLSGHQVGAPTEEERLDALEVLREGSQDETVGEDVLYREAEAIMRDSSLPVE